MSIKKLRLQRGWSQQHLAQISGLSVRTIQRIESGNNPGLGTLQSLAAVFETSVVALQADSNMKTDKVISQQEQEVIEQVRAKRDFYSHLLVFLFTCAVLLFVNYNYTPSYIWAWWAVLGWGTGVLGHAMTTFEVFNIFSDKWEKQQRDKRLDRKL